MISETSSAEFSQIQYKKQVKSNNPSVKKINQNFIQRTLATIFMLIAFICIIISGQTYCALLVLVINFMMFKELNSLKRNQQKQSKIPLSGYLNWYIYFIINYYAIGITLQQKFPYLIKAYQFPFLFLYRYHNIITCILSISAFIFFVLSLKQNYLKYQFRMFGWIIISGFMIVYPSYYTIRNCFQGLIWFLMPALLIIINDIFAYLFGYFFGKKQLISISPKKTWQGYIGGAISTIIFSILLTSLFQKIPLIACKLSRITFVPLSYSDCQQPLLFKEGDYFSELTQHMIIIGLFASLVGPFGGFFASGLKRSIKIKDFANLIPGHGGVTDRMDCQILMGAFMYFYLHSFVIVPKHDTYYSLWASTLSIDQKLQLFTFLKQNITIS